MNGSTDEPLFNSPADLRHAIDALNSLANHVGPDIPMDRDALLAAVDVLLDWKRTHDAE